MSTRPSRTVPALVAALAVVLAGGLLGLATVHADGERVEDTRAGAAHATTTGNTVGADAGPSASGGPVSNPPGTTPGSPDGAGIAPSADAPAARAGEGAEGLGPPQDPGPTSPPRPGRYRYRVTAAQEAEDVDVEIVHLEGSGRDVTQRITTEGERSSSSSEVAWSAEAARVTRTTFTVGRAHGDCDWEPNLVALQLPLAAGTRWGFDSRCTFLIDGRLVTVHRAGQVEVVRAARVRVAGAAVDVWELRRTVKTELDGATFDSEEEATSVELFSPRLGLNVREETTSKAERTFRGTTRSSTATTMRELLHLDPS